MKSFAILAFLLSTQFITFSATSNDEIIKDESYQPKKKKKIYNSYIADELKKNKHVSDFLHTDIDEFLEIIPNLSLDLEDSENIKENLVGIMKDTRLENESKIIAALRLWDISPIEVMKTCCDLLIDENPMWLEEFLENSFYKSGGTKTLIDSAPQDKLLLRTFFLYLTRSKQANPKTCFTYIMSALKTIDPSTAKGVIETTQKMFAAHNFTPKQCFGAILSLDLLGIYAPLTVQFMEIFEKIEKTNFKQIIQCTKSIAEGKNLSLDHYTSILEALNQVDPLKYPQIVKNTKILTNGLNVSSQTYHALIRCGELIDGDLQILWTATCHMCELDVQKRNEILLQIKTMAQTPNWTPSDSFATIKAFYFVVNNQSPNIQNLYTKLGIKKFSTLFRSANMHMQQNPATIDEFLNVFMTIDENHHEDIIRFLNDVFYNKNISADIAKISITRLSEIFQKLEKTNFKEIIKCTKLITEGKNLSLDHYASILEALNQVDPLKYSYIIKNSKILSNGTNLTPQFYDALIQIGELINDNPQNLWNVTTFMIGLDIELHQDIFKALHFFKKDENYSATDFLYLIQALRCNSKNNFADSKKLIQKLGIEEYCNRLKKTNELVANNPTYSLTVIETFININNMQYTETINFLNKFFQEKNNNFMFSRIRYILCFKDVEYNKFKHIKAALNDPSLPNNWPETLNLILKNCKEFKSKEILSTIYFLTKGELFGGHLIVETLKKLAQLKNTHPSFDYSFLKKITPENEEYLVSANRIITKLIKNKNSRNKKLIKIIDEFLKIDSEIIKGNKKMKKEYKINTFLFGIRNINECNLHYVVEILKIINLYDNQIIKKSGKLLKKIQVKEICEAIKLLIPEEKSEISVSPIPNSINLPFKVYLDVIRFSKNNLNNIKMNDTIYSFLYKAMGTYNQGIAYTQDQILHFLKWILENHSKDREQAWVLSHKYMSFMDKFSSEDRELFQALRQKERQKLAFLNNNIDYELNDIDFITKETKDFINNFLIASTPRIADKKSNDTFIDGLINHNAWKHSFVNMIEDQGDMIDLIDYKWENPVHKKHILIVMRNRLLKK